MNRTLALLLPLLAIMGVGCVQTHVHEFHRDPAFDDHQFQKLIVHCSAEENDHRRLLEDIVAERLRQAGYDSVASHGITAQTPGGTKTAFSLRDYPGFDALVWVGWGEYEQTITRTPGYVDHYVSLGYSDYCGYGGFGISTVIVAPRETVRWWLRTRIELIDADSEQKVWSGKADTYSKSEDLSDLAADLAEEIISILGQRPGQVRHG